MTNQNARRSALKTFGLAAGTALLSATGQSQAMAADTASLLPEGQAIWPN